MSELKATNLKGLLRQRLQNSMLELELRFDEVCVCLT